MAQKYQVNLPIGGTKEEKEYEGGYLTVREAAFITCSVRLEIQKAGKLPDAPCDDLVEAGILLADISGFTALGEKLREKHGDAQGAEEFALQMSDAISALVNIVHKYEGEVVKIAGDCLICIFVQEAQDEDDEEDYVCSRQLIVNKRKDEECIYNY